MFKEIEDPGISKVQSDAQKEMLLDFEIRKGIKLEHDFNLPVGNGSSICVDGYCASPATVCEAWAHIGPTSAGHVHKVMQDVLKMLLLEEKLGRGHGLEKFYIFVDDKSTNVASASFKSGTSWKAACFYEFGIKIFLAEILPETRTAILDAQKRQRR